MSERFWLVLVLMWICFVIVIVLISGGGHSRPASPRWDCGSLGVQEVRGNAGEGSPMPLVVCRDGKVFAND